MRDLLRRIFRLDVYSADPIRRFRAASSYVTAAVLILLMIMYTIYQLSSGQIAAGDQFAISTIALGILFVILSIIVIVVTRTGQQTLGAALLVFAWFLPGLWFIAFTDNFTVGLATILVGLVLSALLIGPRSTIVAFVISSVVIEVSSFINAKVQFAPAYVLMLMLQTIISYSLARNLPAVAREVVAEANRQRLRLAETSSAITQRMLAARLDMNMLLTETVNLVKDVVPDDIDSVQIFMVEPDRRNAKLVASTERTQTNIGQMVGIGSLNIVGRVTITGQKVLVRDTNEERAYRREGFLPGTRAELVLPLLTGEETIGVLDIQSKKSEAFPPDDVKTLETIAGQIAIVIDNARLFADAQNRLSENTKLYRQTRNQLREIERLNQQLTGGAWSEYLRSQSTSSHAYTIDLETGQVENIADWTPLMAEASRRNQLVSRLTPTVRVISVPISVRGQPIGAMEFEVDPTQEFNAEQLNVLQQVVERLGFAIENTRLFEETQRIAQREALVNEISARMQVTTNVEAVIQAATQSLADAFQAPRVAIRLGTPNVDGTNGSETA